MIQFNKNKNKNKEGGRSGWPPSRAQAGPEEADVMASKQQGAAQ